jgi:hypothetical protein
MKRIIAVIAFTAFAVPVSAQQLPTVSAAVTESSPTSISAEPSAERTELTGGYFDPSN